MSPFSVTSGGNLGTIISRRANKISLHRNTGDICTISLRIFLASDSGGLRYLLARDPLIELVRVIRMLIEWHTVCIVLWIDLQQKFYLWNRRDDISLGVPLQVSQQLLLNTIIFKRMFLFQIWNMTFDFHIRIDKQYKRKLSHI